MNLQLKRNDEVIIGKDRAYELLDDIVIANSEDGAPILVRYCESEELKDIVDTLLVVGAVDGNYTVYEGVEEIKKMLKAKQDKLTAGDGIRIVGNEISVVAEESIDHIYKGEAGARAWKEFLRVRLEPSINGQFTFLVGYDVYGGASYDSSKHNAIISVNVSEYGSNGQILGEGSYFKIKRVDDSENGAYLSLIAKATMNFGVSMIGSTKTNESEYEISGVLSFVDNFVGDDARQTYDDLIPYDIEYTAGNGIDITNGVISCTVEPSQPITFKSLNGTMDVKYDVETSTLTIDKMSYYDDYEKYDVTNTNTWRYNAVTQKQTNFSYRMSDKVSYQEFGGNVSTQLDGLHFNPFIVNVQQFTDELEGNDSTQYAYNCFKRKVVYVTNKISCNNEGVPMLFDAGGGNKMKRQITPTKSDTPLPNLDIIHCANGKAIHQLEPNETVKIEVEYVRYPNPKNPDGGKPALLVSFVRYGGISAKNYDNAIFLGEYRDITVNADDLDSCHIRICNQDCVTLDEYSVCVLSNISKNFSLKYGDNQTKDIILSANVPQLITIRKINGDFKIL